MEPISITPAGDGYPTITPPESATPPTPSSTTESVEPTSTAIIQIPIGPTPTTTATRIEHTSSTTTEPPTPTTTTMTAQIGSAFTTTTKESPKPLPLLSTESSQVSAPTTQSGHSSSVTPSTASLILDNPTLTQNTPPSTSNTHSTTSNTAGVRISHILPAVLVPMACLIAILVISLLIWRSRRRMRGKRATENPFPFISQSHTPGLSSVLATNTNGAVNAGISEKRRPLRSGNDIGFCDFVHNEGMENEGEPRPWEEASVSFRGGNDTVPGLREQILVLQAQIADIEEQCSSHGPPDYSSIDRD